MKITPGNQHIADEPIESEIQVENVPALRRLSELIIGYGKKKKPLKVSFQRLDIQVIPEGLEPTTS